MIKDDSYDILYDKSIKALKARVEDKKKRGFKCIGGVFIHDQAESNGTEKIKIPIFYQAMEKKE